MDKKGIKKKRLKSLNVRDLFCGTGRVRGEFQQVGFHVFLGLDCEGDIR